MFNTCRILTRPVPTFCFIARRFITSGTVPSQAAVVMNFLIAGRPLCSPPFHRQIILYMYILNSMLSQSAGERIQDNTDAR